MNVDFSIIKTKNILLRRFEECDLENVFKGLSHPDVIKYYGVNFDSREATKAQMDFFANLEKEGTGIWWAICSIDNKTFYGGAGLNDVIKDHNKAEIGFWLLPEFWGKGIIKEAIPLVCDFGFERLGLHRIEAIIESANIASKKVITHSGFQHEGTMKECEFKNGKYISLDIYAKISHQ